MDLVIKIWKPLSEIGVLDDAESVYSKTLETQLFNSNNGVLCLCGLYKVSRYNLSHDTGAMRNFLLVGIIASKIQTSGKKRINPDPYFFFFKKKKG